jgi:hypothetical protein
VGHRNIAVLDLAAGTETVLAEQRDIDDQLEWLDDRTVVYSVPRDDSGQDSNVWSLAIDPAAQPSLLVEHAWSPAVVRQQPSQRTGPKSAEFRQHAVDLGKQSSRFSHSGEQKHLAPQKPYRPWVQVVCVGHNLRF